jgi:hypothetical protein
VGAGEGLFFFIVPDVYIGFATMFALRAGAVAWLSSVVGSRAAIPRIYLLTIGLNLDYLGFLDKSPGIPGSLVAQVRESLARNGLPYTPFLARGGVPLKLYAATASLWGCPSVQCWSGPSSPESFGSHRRLRWLQPSGRSSTGASSVDRVFGSRCWCCSG